MVSFYESSKIEFVKKAYIKTFNLTFWIVILVTIFLGYLFTVFANSVDYKTSLTVFFVIHIIAVIYYFSYKVGLTKDKEYNDFLKEHNLPYSEFYSEIFPCQLCNLSYIIIPISLITKNEYLIAFSMITFPLGLIVALLMPSPGLSDDCFFKRRVSGFYITHVYIIFMSIVLWNYHFIELNYFHVLTSIFVLFCLQICAHILNTILIKTDLTKSANYLFTIHHAGNPVLKFLQDKIKIKLVYLFPLYPVAALLYAMVIFIARLFY